MVCLRRPQLSSKAFMLPSIILIMSVMMIVGSVALMQANNVLNIASGLGDLSTARSAAKAGAEYAQVTFNNTNCWIGTSGDSPDNGGEGDVEISNSGTDKQKITFEVIPDNKEDGSPYDKCSATDLNVTVIGKVYGSQSAATPKKTYSLRSTLGKYQSLGSGLLLSGGGYNRGLSGAARAQVAGKDLVFGVYGNTDRGDHFLCMDLSKEDSETVENTQFCDGVGDEGTPGSEKEVTYIPSDGSPTIGLGANEFMSLGAGGNIGSAPFYDENPGVPNVAARYYFGAHFLGPPGNIKTDDKIGFVCVEITQTGSVRPCTLNGQPGDDVTPATVFKAVETGSSVAPAGETNEPNQMFDGPIYHKNGSNQKLLYGLAGKSKTGFTGRKVYCWNITLNAVCSGQPFTTNLPDFEPDQHHYFDDYAYRYGMYAVSAKDETGGKIYWAINYSTFVNTWDTWIPPYWTSCWTPGWGWLPCVGGGYYQPPVQRTYGTRFDCFNLATNSACTTKDNNATTFLDGDTPVTMSNHNTHSFVFQPFFLKSSVGTPTSVCASVAKNAYYMRPYPAPPIYFDDGTNQRQIIRCYRLDNQQEDTSAAVTTIRDGLEGGLHGSYTMGVSLDATGKFSLSGIRTYFAYTAFDHPMIDPNPGDIYPLRTDLPQPKRDRSIGICWDWSKPNGGGRCDGWTTNKTWPSAPPSQNMNVNLLVAGFTTDNNCLIAMSATNLSAGVFGVDPASGEETCNPSTPTGVF